MNRVDLSIFIPDSLTAETGDLKIKTYKVGLIARAASIFGVKRIVIYHDDADGEARFIRDILTYMDTPQYLRRKVFPIMRELKHVGILPPLRTPHHPTGKPVAGEYRQGLTVKRVKKGTLVDIGADKLALCREKLTVNRIMSFRVARLGKEILIEPDEPDDIYWGYEVLDTRRNLTDSLKTVGADVVVATSRNASPITSILDEVKSRMRKAREAAILFGGPYKGLPEIKADIWVNTLPGQCTETVRTEEAVLATLSVFNMLTQIDEKDE
ncbi:RNA-binding protein [Methanothermobacter thermautotrophicus]|jgi:predicted SPOUT superfamily RNA methylase MTH1|uniref:RNA-binding protein n=1 Tax=Methanothermobacter thermautotrophicus TaxID=145262 RepID=A0A842YKC8_METTF|nr:putative RNA uridine N3 methyltransferase [Methanothermobacter thermautotrophicus]MBE2899248.1 RNA-binding protein [Methanothermobacter thermautotrophicus]MCQ8905313.1 RNA-binding protein [Methanothermobacter sp.]